MCVTNASVPYFQVVEVVNGDAVVVKIGEGQFKKCFLASIKPPRYGMILNEG